MRLLIMTCILLACEAGAAQIRSINEAGIGFTDNANLEESQRDSDFFFRASTTNSHDAGSHKLGLRLSYVGYTNQTVNNLFSWRISDRFAPNPAGWEFYGALLGQDYVAGDPGTTESSFDNIGWEFTASKPHSLNPHASLKFGPGASGRYYTSLSNRSDHRVFGYAEFDFESSTKTYFGARSELGFQVSSDHDYSQTYLELSGDIDYRFSDRWSFYNELGIRQTGFPGRNLSDQTIVNRQRGRQASLTPDSQIESHGLIYLYSEVMKDIRDDIQGGLSLRYSAQTSRSGNQNFTLTELYGRIIFTF